MRTNESAIAPPDDADYEKFQPNVAVWNGTDAFLQAPCWGEGAHIVMLPSGVHLDLLIGGDLREIPVERCLPVVFSGAVSKRNGNRGPFYSDLGLATSVDSPFVAISDATLNTNLYLKLGWYAGRAKDSVQAETLRLLAGIATRFERELLLVGGSGGGFASLYYAARLDSPVSAMVWNPQTDFLNYLPSVVTDYLVTALGLSDDEVSRMSDAERSQALAAGGVEHNVVPRSTYGTGCRRVLYLQNADDGHVVQHAAPYLSQAEFTHVGGGRWVDDRGALVLISSFSEGHNPPPRDAMVQAMRSLLDTATSPSSVVDALQSSNLIPGTGLDTLPRDLRGEVNELRERIELVASTDSTGALQARLAWSETPNRFGGINTTFEFSGSEGPFERSHRANHVVVPAPPSPARTVSARVRDGFMNELFVLTTDVVETPHQVRVFIVGSCVSRDSYEFLDPAFFALNGYLARQSLISGFAAPFTAELNSSWLQSPFQRRMLEADAESRLPSILSEAASRTDLLLWDLVDERLGVFDHGGNVWTTDSVELRGQPGGSLARASARHVAFGSPEHFALFEASLVRWKALLTDVELIDRTILLAPRWAEVTEAGAKTPTSFGLSATDANRVTDSYVEAVQRIVGVPVVGRTDPRPVSLTSHQWGVAPFHYDDATYLSLTHQIAAKAEELCAPFGWGDTRGKTRVPTPEQRDPLLRAPAPELEMRQTGPLEVTVRVIAKDMQACAFQLHRGPQRVESTAYRRESTHRFRVALPGIYRCRAFVMTTGGDRVPVVSVPLRVSG